MDALKITEEKQKQAAKTEDKKSNLINDLEVIK